MKSTKVLMVSAVLALTVGCAGTAFAASGTSTLSTSDGKQDVPVTGTYRGDNPEAVYSVDVVWDDMTFTYTTTGTSEWQPDTHTYTINGGTGTWAAAGGGTSAGITATNHSNAAVKAAFAFAEDPNTVGDYTGSLSNAGKQLAAGVENDPDGADNVTSELSFTGTLGVENTTDANLGTLTVQLSPVN